MALGRRSFRRNLEKLSNCSKRRGVWLPNQRKRKNSVSCSEFLCKNRSFCFKGVS